MNAATRQRCGAYLRGWDKRGQRKCGARATAGYVADVGYRCRRHSPRQVPCWICGRRICRETGNQTCLVTGIHNRARTAGWTAIPDAQKTSYQARLLHLALSHADVATRQLPRTIDKDDTWAPKGAVSVWEEVSRFNPHETALQLYRRELAHMHLPSLPTGQVDELVTMHTRHRALKALER